MLGIAGAGSLELKIAYALRETEKANFTIFHDFCPDSVYCNGFQAGQMDKNIQQAHFFKSHISAVESKSKTFQMMLL